MAAWTAVVQEDKPSADANTASSEGACFASHDVGTSTTTVAQS